MIFINNNEVRSLIYPLIKLNLKLKIIQNSHSCKVLGTRTARNMLLILDQMFWHLALPIGFWDPDPLLWKVVPISTYSCQDDYYLLPLVSSYAHVARKLLQNNK